MDISAILKRSWDITWKSKGLWVLGILAGCSGGGGGGSSNAGRTAEYRFSGDDFPQIQRWVEGIPEEAWGTIAIAATGVVLLLALGAWVLSTLGNGGLIAGFGLADSNETITLGLAFREGSRYFWKLLLIQIIPVLLTLLLFIPVILGFVALGVLTAGIGIACLLPLLCLLVPASILLNIYLLITQIALVNDKLAVGAAFKQAWEVIRKETGNILILAIALGIGNFIASLILALPFFLLAIPVFIGIAGGGDPVTMANFTPLLVGGLIYLPIGVTAGGILRTFITGSWTLTYREMTAPEIVPA